MSLFDGIERAHEAVGKEGSKELKIIPINKCPFCGNKCFDELSEDAIVVIEGIETTRRGFVSVVGCRKCGAWGPQKETALEAVKAWNEATNRKLERKHKRKGLLKNIL